MSEGATLAAKRKLPQQQRSSANNSSNSISVSSLLNQFKLDADDKYKARCGEIYITKKNILAYHCTLCKARYASCSLLLRHISVFHFTLSKSAYTTRGDRVATIPTATATKSAPRLQVGNLGMGQRSAPVSTNELRTRVQNVADKLKSVGMLRGATTATGQRVAMAKPTAQRSVASKISVQDQAKSGSTLYTNKLGVSNANAESERKELKYEELQRDAFNALASNTVTHVIASTTVNIEHQEQITGNVVRQQNDETKPTVSEAAQMEQNELLQLLETSEMEEANDIEWAPCEQEVKDETVDVNMEVPDSTSNQKTEPKKPKSSFSKYILTQERKVKCPQCDETFQLIRDVRAHLNAMHKTERFSCDLCPSTFKEEHNMRAHRRRHTEQPRFLCKYCAKPFHTNTERSQHMRRHTGEKPYMCAECGRSFFTCGSLTEHQRRHTNNRRHQCTYCDKRFYNPTLLKDHLVVHTGERAHKCDVCDTTFSRRKALLVHMKLHANLREYECQICHASFNQGPALYLHFKSKHGEIPKIESRRKQQLLLSDITELLEQQTQGNTDEEAQQLEPEMEDSNISYEMVRIYKEDSGEEE